MHLIRLMGSGLLFGKIEESRAITMGETTIQMIVKRNLQSEAKLIWISLLCLWLSLKMMKEMHDLNFSLIGKFIKVQNCSFLSFFFFDYLKKVQQFMKKDFTLVDDV